MTINRKKINSTLKSDIVPFLRELGFRGTFPHFRRVNNNKIDLLMFQFSQFEKQFIVEIAQCSLGGITFANGKKVAPEKVKVYHCFPKNRTRIPIKKEDFYRWINYENGKLNEIVKQVFSLIKNEAIPWWKNKQAPS